MLVSSILPKNKLENLNFCPSLLGHNFSFVFWRIENTKMAFRNYLNFSKHSYLLNGLNKYSLTQPVNNLKVSKFMLKISVNIKGSSSRTSPYAMNGKLKLPYCKVPIVTLYSYLSILFIHICIN